MATLFLTSCQKDVVATDTVKDTAANATVVTYPSDVSELRAIFPTIKKGRLYFESQEKFKNYMATIAKYSVEQIEAVNAENNFVSHAVKSQQEPKAPASASAGKEDESAKWVIPDPYFAETLDENREIYVGGSEAICRAGNDFTFVFNDGDQYKIDNFYADYQRGGVTIPEEGGDYDGIFVYPTNIELPEGKAQVRDLFQQVKKCWSFFDGSQTWRTYGEIWQGNWFVYASNGVKTECNKVTKFWFFSYFSFKNASQLRVKWNATLQIPANTQSNPTSNPINGLNVGELVGTNTSRVINRFDFMIASISNKFPYIKLISGTTLKLISCKSTHTGTLNGVTRTCDLMFP